MAAPERALPDPRRGAAGHITAGGAVCLEALSRGSGPSAWQAAYTMESILLLVPALALLRPSPRLCCVFNDLCMLALHVKV